MDQNQNRYDYIKFKDDVLKDVRELQKKITDQLNNKNKELIGDINNIRTKLSEISKTANNVKNTVVEHKTKLEKIEDLEKFRQKFSDMIITHDIRIDTVINDIEKIKIKYDRAIFENLTISGWVGFNCKFKSIGELILNYINELTKIKTEKDELKKQVDDTKKKIDITLKTASNMVESGVNRSNEYSDNKQKNLENLLNNKFNDLNNKFTSYNEEFINQNKKINEKINEINNEVNDLKIVTNIKNELMDIIDIKVKNVIGLLNDKDNQINENISNLNKLFEKNEEKMKSFEQRFQELNYHLKSVNTNNNNNNIVEFNKNFLNNENNNININNQNSKNNNEINQNQQKNSNNLELKQTSNIENKPNKQKSSSNLELNQKDKKEKINENNQNKRKASIEKFKGLDIKSNLIDIFTSQKVKQNLNQTSKNENIKKEKENNHEIKKSKSFMSQSELDKSLDEKSNEEKFKKETEIKKPKLKKRKSIFDINYNNKIDLKLNNNNGDNIKADKNISKKYHCNNNEKFHKKFLNYLNTKISTNNNLNIIEKNLKKKRRLSLEGTNNNEIHNIEYNNIFYNSSRVSKNNKVKKKIFLDPAQSLQITAVKKRTKTSDKKKEVITQSGKNKSNNNFNLNNNNNNKKGIEKNKTVNNIINNNFSKKNKNINTNSYNINLNNIATINDYNSKKNNNVNNTKKNSKNLNYNNEKEISDSDLEPVIYDTTDHIKNNLDIQTNLYDNLNLEEPDILRRKIKNNLNKIKTTSPDLLPNNNKNQLCDQKLNYIKENKSNFDSYMYNNSSQPVLYKEHMCSKGVNTISNFVNYRSLSNNIIDYQNSEVECRMCNVDLPKDAKLPPRENVDKNYSLSGKKYYKKKVNESEEISPTDSLYKIYFQKKMKNELLPNLNNTNSNNLTKVSQAFGRTTYKIFDKTEINK